jgi:hypothetical protein
MASQVSRCGFERNGPGFSFAHQYNEVRCPVFKLALQARPCGIEVHGKERFPVGHRLAREQSFEPNLPQYLG